MANKTITELPVAANVEASDAIVTVQGGVTYQATPELLTPALTVASGTSPGILSADDYDLFSPLRRKTHIVYFEEEFILSLGFTVGAAGGGGAGASLLSAAGAHPGGRCTISTGSTAAGECMLRTPVNLFYITTIDRLHWVTLAGFTALSDDTERFKANICVATSTNFNAPGWSFHYDHTLSPNWLLVRWGASGIAESVNTGVTVTSSPSPPYATQRFEIIFDRATNTLTGFIDGAQVGVINNNFTGTSAVYLIPGIMTKLVGTTNRAMVMDYTACVAVPGAAYRK